MSSERQGWRPRASLGWGHEWADTERVVDAHFTGGGGSFHIQGAQADRDLALAGIGVDADLAPGAILSFDADGGLGPNQRQGSLSAAIRFRW